MALEVNRMTAEEDELRQALGTRPAPTNLTPAIAFVIAAVLTVTSVGVLVATRHLGRSTGATASGARVETPSPTTKPAGGFNFQLSVPSANAVWALYDPDKLYRSTDQGNTWTLHGMPSPFGVHPVVSFINDLEGWWLAPGSPATQCQAEDVALWHTTDAGATWQQLPAAGIVQSQCKNGIWFVDAKHGFLAAWDQNHQPTVYYTADGGTTWRAHTVQDPAYFKSKSGGFTLQVDWIRQFGGTAYLEAFGAQDDPNLPHDNQFILKSTDGGASWMYVTKVPSREVVMVTESRWLDFTAPGQAMESINRGQQFHQYTSDFSTQDPRNTQLVFADENVGYAASPGQLERTADGGKQWTRLAAPGVTVTAPSPSPSATPIRGDLQLSAPSSSVVWALVAGLYLFRSTDHGTTWQRRTMPEFAAKAHIAFANDQDGWVFFVVDSPDCMSVTASSARRQVTQGVEIYRTVDGAATWTLVDSAVDGRVSAGGLPLEQCKTAFDFSDPLHGLVGTTDLLSLYVWRTSDGGITWAETRLPDPPGWVPGDTRPRTIKSFGATALVYGPPYFWQSADWGATWRNLEHGMVTPLTIVTPNRWLVIFPASTHETLDAGATWHDFPTDYHTDSTVSEQFVFADDKVGYGTDLGRVIRTLDGGGHWELIKTSWP
jgi:photosystem II stability/assembly factor-like uncharacterized protein